MFVITRKIELIRLNSQLNGIPLCVPNIKALCCVFVTFVCVYFSVSDGRQYQYK